MHNAHERQTTIANNILINILEHSIERMERMLRVFCQIRIFYTLPRIGVSIKNPFDKMNDFRKNFQKNKKKMCPIHKRISSKKVQNCSNKSNLNIECSLSLIGPVSSRTNDNRQRGMWRQEMTTKVNIRKGIFMFVKNSAFALCAPTQPDKIFPRHFPFPSLDGNFVPL